MNLRRILFSTYGKIFLVILGLAIYYAVFIYPLNSLLKNLDFFALEILFDEVFHIHDVLLVLAFTIPLLGRLAYQIFKNQSSKHFMALAMTWSGFAFFIFFPTLALDITHSLYRFSDNTLKEITIAFLLIAILSGLYGVINANLLFVHKLEISDPRITKETTAIQLSDIHIGSRSPFFINKIISRVNQLNADKVFITGDLVDLSAFEEKDLSLLKKIQAPVYFVTGNHDRYVSLDRLLPLLKKQGFIILRNETLSLEEFDVTGIDDAEHTQQVKEQLANMNLNLHRFNILLYHRPQGFEDAIEKGVDLMLSGHTHNGQIVPFNLMVKQIFKNMKGTIKKGKATLHVSTGTSTWGPIMRIGSLNEITLIHFKP